MKGRYVLKAKRHTKILELIQTNTVETQEDLLSLLKKEGFNATQATVSRDIKELKLQKSQSNNGKYYYSNKIVNKAMEKKDFSNLFSNSVINIDYASNMIVIKTSSGMAQGVCVTIDNLELNGIVGTIAGDDTIFIVVRNSNIASIVASQLKKYL